MSAQRLTFPNLRQGTDENFRWAVHLSRTANGTRHLRRKDGNALRKAWGLRSAGFALDQGLACSDQDWHSGRLAR